MTLIPFCDNEEAARNVWDASGLASGQRDGYSLRPFNRFDPKWTEWWVVPGKSEWPAYRCSKLFIGNYPPAEPEGNGLFVGYCVEKGLDPKIIDMAAPSQIMKADWCWHQFIKDVSTAAFAETIDTARTESGQPVQLCCDAYGFNDIPRNDTSRSHPSASLRALVGEGGSISGVEQSGGRILPKVESGSSLSEVVGSLNAQEGLAFYWIDVHIGVRLELVADTAAAKDGQFIWQSCLKPWMRWVSECAS